MKLTVETSLSSSEYGANVKQFAAFMVARQQVLLRRKAGLPAPWTDDPVLRDNRFCNVFREDDRVTIWIREHIREPFADHPNLWFMLAIARIINWPPTLDYLIKVPGAWPVDDDNFDPQSIEDVLTGLAADKQKVYTGAYMIRSEPGSKHRYIAHTVLGRLWGDREKLRPEIEAQDTLQGAWSLLQPDRYVGWGPFMVYEWVTDLRHTRYLRSAQDIYSWANAGPGAIRGLNRLHKRMLGAATPAAQCCIEMQTLLSRANYCWGGEFSKTFLTYLDDRPRFEMRDIEHSLCEFDKYLRTCSGQGTTRSKYDWTPYAKQNRRT